MDSDRLEFVLHEGDLMGLTTTPNHLVFRWNRDDCKVLFSAARQGKAMSCHFASDRRGLRHLKDAIDKFVCSVFSAFPWCRMILANVQKASVGRLISKIDFTPIAEVDDMIIYMRVRPWAA